MLLLNVLGHICKSLGMLETILFSALTICHTGGLCVTALQYLVVVFSLAL